MIRHKWITAVAAVLMAVAVLGTLFAALRPHDTSGKSNASAAATKYVAAMDKTQIMDIQIVADQSSWDTMIENATSEEYIAVTVIIGGKKIENVGIRAKGNSSLSMVASSSQPTRYSFKIEFDHYIDGQTWLGLDKLVINNMSSDNSYLKEYLSYDIMNYAGVETPLYAFADITVNGEPFGFYLAVEALEDSYVNRVYGTDHGELYKPEQMGMRGEGRMNDFIADLEGGAEAAGDAPQTTAPQTGDQNQTAPPEPPADQTGDQTQTTNPQTGDSAAQQGGNFVMGGGGMSGGGVTLQYTDDQISSYDAIFENAVLDTATTADKNRLIAALEKLSKGEDLAEVTDVEAVLKYFAAHTVVVNLDSYVSNMGHNYYLYEQDGQLTILPWDYNLSFGGFQSGNSSSVVNFPIETPVSGVSLEDRPLLGQLLAVPEYMALYKSYLHDIVDGYFGGGAIEQTIDTLDALIAEHVAADPTALCTYAEYETAVTELKKLCVLRAESIRGQLDGTIPATTAGQNADASALVDASSVNLSALGSQGGGGGGMRTVQEGDIGGGFVLQGDFTGTLGAIDADKVPAVIEIFSAAGAEELTEEQRAALRELGLTDEQIDEIKAQFQSPRQQGGQMPEGMQGGPPPDGQGRQGGQPPTGQGGQGMQPPDGQGNFTIGGNGPQNTGATTAARDAAGWIELGVALLLLLGCLLFAVLFKRRRT